MTNHPSHPVSRRWKSRAVYARRHGKVLFRAQWLGCLAGSLVTLAGCSPASNSSPGTPTVTTTPTAGGAATSGGATASLTDAQLQDRLDQSLGFTCEGRRLNLRDHAAWQIVHGALAFGRDFRITDNNGQDVPAIQYLMDGGVMTGWRMEAGPLLGNPPRPGLRAIQEPGSKTGQGHPDQWLGYLADVGLKPEDTIKVAGQTFTIADYLRQVEHDVPYAVDQEYSWTLMALTAYHPTNYTWVAADGNTWSVEKLLDIEVNHDLAVSACGGSHRMAGIVMALNRHKAAGGKLEGVWKAADDKVRDCVARAKQYQNPDGSLSTNWFQRTGNSPDIRERLGCTGHVLEFVILASTDEELRQPWIKRAAVYLCDLLEKTRSIDLECGALYHAAHGLVLYRQRLFGPCSYVDATAAASPSSDN